MSELELRLALKTFAQQMEAKLRICDYKGGWEGLSLENLVAGMVEEVEELLTEAGFALDVSYAPCKCNQELVIVQRPVIWQAIAWSIMARSIAWALTILAAVFYIISQAQAH